MKIVMGPLEMVFNETKSPILDDTLKIVDEYRTNVSNLNGWLRNELDGIKNQYEKRQRDLVENAEKELLKYAEKLK